jgi:hypothetical protein
MTRHETAYKSFLVSPCAVGQCYIIQIHGHRNCFSILEKRSWQTTIVRS